MQKKLVKNKFMAVAAFGLKKSIIISLTGGLGNQMFQYAAGRYLSFLKKCKLKLDIAAYNKNNYRRFGLNDFNIKGKYIRGTLLSRLVYKLKLKLGIYSVYYESILSNINEFENLPGNIILNGYWQSERYFSEIENIIREDFTFKKGENIDKFPIMAQINQSISVAIHIRRGDYVSNELFNSVHGVCSDDYYQRSIEYIAKKIESPVFFIFSDDIVWVKKHIKLTHSGIYIDDLVYLGRNIDHAIIDLYLMTQCKHNILANSSFSWWGAWLNQNPGKIVVAPKKWFNDESIDTSDLIPSTWIRI